MKEYGVSFEFQNLRPPDQDVIEGFLSQARHSAPGPDGIPYGAWRATHTTGARVLARVFAALCAGSDPIFEFNESLGIFLAKGTAADDSSLLLKRVASDTRPLACKNTDNKTLAGAVNHTTMSPQISKLADDQQEGFVKRRQIISDIVTLDCHTRALDAAASFRSDDEISLIPLMLLFDFAAAFPSLAHDYIFVMLEALKVPKGMLRF